MKFLEKFFLFFLFSSFLFSQDVHTRLKDPKLIQKFHAISEKIRCMCGCNLPLRYCNHSQCMAWSMRSVIEGFLKEGKEGKWIITHFIQGFPSSLIEKSPAFQYTKKEYASLLPLYQKGWGKEILAYPDSILPQVFILLFLFLGGSIAFFYLKKRRKKASFSSSLSLQEKEALENELLSSL